jgi:hypothetical protein
MTGCTLGEFLNYRKDEINAYTNRHVSNFFWRTLMVLKLTILTVCRFPRWFEFKWNKEEKVLKVGMNILCYLQISKY